MKKTVFNSKHHQLGARLVDFAGYEMPVEYSGINDEHLAVRIQPASLTFHIWARSGLRDPPPGYSLIMYYPMILVC